MNETSSGGIGFLGLLALVFIVLKLADVTAVATWSWWWVLAPIWIPWAIFVVVALIAGLVWLVVRDR